MTDALKKQVGGEHYNKHTIQPWHIIDNYKLDFYEGNALKYLLRDKNSRIEDVEKCIHYLERKLELLKNGPKKIKTVYANNSNKIERGTILNLDDVDKVIYIDDNSYVPLDSLGGQEIYKEVHGG